MYEDFFVIAKSINLKNGLKVTGQEVCWQEAKE